MSSHLAPILALFFAAFISTGCISPVTPLLATTTPTPRAQQETADELVATPTATPPPSDDQSPTPTPGDPALVAALGAAPDGYQWVIIDEAGAAFLAPDGWHVLHEEVEHTLALFVSEENIDEIGYFATGLSVNIVPELDISATEYARAFIGGIAQEPRISEVLSVAEIEFGPFSGLAVELIGEAPATTPNDPNLILKHMHYLALGNQMTNTLYIIWFESPADTWEDAWVHGTVMLENMALSPGY